MPNPTAEESMLFDELIDGVLGAGDHASFSRTGSSNGSGLMPATLSRGGSTTGSGHMSIEAASFLEGLSLPEVTLGMPMAVPVAPLPMMVATESVSAAVFACWGAELMGTAVHCTPGFVSGKAHFKNKFCARCREGIEVPVRRIRALTADQKRQVHNSLQTGFWKRAPAGMGGGEVRIANNTITCDGPWLAVFRHDPPPIAFELLPPKWQRDDVVKLVVAKGTLVPSAEIYWGRRSWMPSLVNVAKRRRRAANGDSDSDAAASADAEALSTTDASMLALPPLGSQAELPDWHGQDAVSGAEDDGDEGGFVASLVASLGRGGAAGGGSRPLVPTPTLPIMPTTTLPLMPTTTLPMVPMTTRRIKPMLTALVASHAQVIATLEAAISLASVGMPEVRARLEQQLAAARNALQETHRLATLDECASEVEISGSISGYETSETGSFSMDQLMVSAEAYTVLAEGGMGLAGSAACSAARGAAGSSASSAAGRAHASAHHGTTGSAAFCATCGAAGSARLDARPPPVQRVPAPLPLRRAESTACEISRAASSAPNPRAPSSFASSGWSLRPSCVSRDPSSPAKPMARRANSDTFVAYSSGRSEGGDAEGGGAQRGGDGDATMGGATVDGAMVDSSAMVDSGALHDTRAHALSAAQIFKRSLSRGSSDGKILSKDSRREGLIEGMRRLFVMGSNGKSRLGRAADMTEQ
jgi:hypothetical protein